MGKAVAKTSRAVMSEMLIAPCGMNCALCASCLAGINDIKSRGIQIPYCAGCRPRGKLCAFLKKRCDLLKKGTVKFCNECKDFPCKNLKGIDERYRTTFRMSLIGNLADIRKKGMKYFLAAQKRKWRCSRCGGVLCCHNGLCFRCDVEKLRRRKNKYRWKDD